jgi:hypothetical protein
VPAEFHPSLQETNDFNDARIDGAIVDERGRAARRNRRVALDGYVASGSCECPFDGTQGSGGTSAWVLLVVGSIFVTLR